MEILDVNKGAYTGPARRILVFGGSQGARFLNQTAPLLIKEISKHIPGVTVVHQTGVADVAMAEQAYRDAGLKASISPYIEDMAGAYRWADFVVARSGAGTIAELTAVGIPSLLIPFPYAADNHQYYNALAMEEAGAAVLIEQAVFDLGRAVDRLVPLLSSKDALNSAADAARSMGRRDASRLIAQGIIELAREVV
jgi:UDP-N-acetylglucosamine--N-acetylmuramyl-(pentapeptide) pyrophosphoryl-undecaprenol N-acetylglucosamine transferase